MKGNAFEKVCQECGFTLDDFNKIRRLGCENCYVVFKKEISKLLSKMHVGKSHKGKKLEICSLQDEKQTEFCQLKEYQKELTKCISERNYESAFQWEKKISKIRKEKKDA